MITFQQVSFTYGEGEHKDAGLKDINLTVNAGECLLLCGPSGCGKTTLTRLINGLAPQFFPGELTGKILLDGEELSSLPLYRIAEKVGSVFQNPRTQFFNTDTGSEIAFGLENKGCPQPVLKGRVADVVSELGLENLYGRSLFELSGGEKQKIAFASVYAMDPDVYLLDEPSSNLDLEAIEELHRYLALVRSRGKTVILAEHRLFYLRDLVDRVLYMKDGGIAAEYTPQEFFALSAAERREMGLRTTDLSAEVPTAFPGVSASPQWEGKGVSFSYQKRQILNEVSFAAAPGEVIAVAGANGAGKTTFCRGLCGLHKESQGKFFYREKELPPKKRLHHSYMVMQDVNYELFAESVAAECGFGLRNPDGAEVAAVLKTLGLEALAERHPYTLSGGEKQRVAVAVSMMCKKDLLIFDEPTSGLDYDSMERTASLIRHLAGLGKTIFIVTHDLEFLCRTCTRLLYLEKGGIAADFPVTPENGSALKKRFCMEGKGGDKK